jgi:hypothetical protein
MTDQKNAHGPFQSTFSTDVLHEWQQGLLQEDVTIQWNTFEKMFGLTDFRVLEIIKRFLVYERGDMLLKTKMVQQLKSICPWSITLEMTKGGKQQTIQVLDVPLNKEEWGAYTKPLDVLEEQAGGHDPTLVDMAGELWILVLEKHYPFLPSFDDAYEWTAALHYYTLKIIQPDRVQPEWDLRWSEVYGLHGQPLQDAVRRLEDVLKSDMSML